MGMLLQGYFCSQHAWRDHSRICASFGAGLRPTTSTSHEPLQYHRDILSRSRLCFHFSLIIFSGRNKSDPIPAPSLNWSEDFNSGKITAMFRSTFHNEVITPITDDVDPKNVIDLLHDHSFIITMSPIVTKHSEKAREGPKITYDIYEKVDLLPFGWWRHEIKFLCSFHDQHDGQVSELQAPMGVTSRATYTVRPTEQKDLQHDEEGSMSKWVLEESIESSCSMFLKLFVEMTMVNVRRQMHVSVIAKAREMGGGQEDAVQQWLHPKQAV